jgi:hypothetical protein
MALAVNAETIDRLLGDVRQYTVTGVSLARLAESSKGRWRRRLVAAAPRVLQLDVRVTLETDDKQHIYMNYRAPPRPQGRDRPAQQGRGGRPGVMGWALGDVRRALIERLHSVNPEISLASLGASAERATPVWEQ